MSRKEMLTRLVNHYSGGNKSQFANMLGVKPQTINTWISRDTFDIELIYARLKGLNANWLLTGEGEMLTSNTHFEKEEESAILSYIEKILKEKEELIMKQNIEIGKLYERLRHYEECASKKAI